MCIAAKARWIVTLLRKCGLLAFALIPILAIGPAVADQRMNEAALAIKATFLYKFAPFVQWPASSFESTNTPLTLCVVGNDPFGEILVEALAGQRIGDRPILLRHMTLAAPGSGCHIMFVGGSIQQSIADGLRAVQGTPVLTVTDGSPDATHGIIEFVIVGDKVRFTIGIAAAAKNGLSINSKLLALAHEVRKEPAP